MKNFKKYAPIILLILHCALISVFSAQDGKSSTAVSRGVVVTVVEVTQKAETLTKPQMNKVEFAVRKTAHFVLFLVLGVYAFLSAGTLKIKRKQLIALLFCFIYAVSDELHQLSSDGRTAEISDVILDTLSSLIGIMLTAFVSKFKIKTR